MSKTVADYVKTIPDFPEPGVMFRDVTSVIEDPDGFQMAIDALDNLIGDTDFDMGVGTESR